MRIKICGLTRLVDVEHCVQLGATHLGFVVAPDSPRRVRAMEVQSLVADVPEGVSSVLVFRRPTVSEVLRAVALSGVHRVQLHEASEEVENTVEGMGCVLHRVARVETAARHLPVLDPTPSSQRLWLLDVGLGGSGKRFDWRLLGTHAPRFCFIAGGIDPENAPLLRERHPWGIDLSSGVESAPGVKDPELLTRLFAAMEGTHAP